MGLNQQFKQTARQAGILLPVVIVVSGCSFFPSSREGPGAAGAGPGRPRQADGPVAVQTAQAKAGSVSGLLTYTGTTRPSQQVTLRSQVSGEVVDLAVDVGDAIAQNQPLAQLDGNQQTTSFNQAQAELSARRAETAQAQVSIRDAQAAVVQAQATFDQAQIDATRLRQLADQGAISQQAAEAAELAVTNAQQQVASAQAQVGAQQQAAEAATDRIDAQQAVLAQTQQQLSYADLRSPLTGVVLSRDVDIGDVVESGDAILELGDLNRLEVTVQVSELDIGQLSVGQAARVQLDAFPGEGSIPGEIEQIAPVADSTSRLVPVQVVIPNFEGRIGSGLLARVQFSPGGQTGQQASVVVPASALSLQQNSADESATAEEIVAEETIAEETVVEETIAEETIANNSSTVFVIEGEGEQAKAIARAVRVGENDQNRVTILSGLEPGSTFVVQSDRPLTSGQPVRLSILSENLSQPNQQPERQPERQSNQQSNQQPSQQPDRQTGKRKTNQNRPEQPSVNASQRSRQ
ncbi:MAG: efflux RND transporter periplasmic adaptor subunit [Cyanobacteria bacterium J06634_5]